MRPPPSCHRPGTSCPAGQPFHKFKVRSCVGPMTEFSPGEVVRARVADADRLRRVRDESRRVWRVAPLAAAACLAVAAAARWLGWSPLVPLGAIALGGGALALAAAAA